MEEKILSEELLLIKSAQKEVQLASLIAENMLLKLYNKYKIDANKDTITDDGRIIRVKEEENISSSKVLTSNFSKGNTVKVIGICSYTGRIGEIICFVSKDNLNYMKKYYKCCSIEKVNSDDLFLIDLECDKEEKEYLIIDSSYIVLYTYEDKNPTVTEETKKDISSENIFNTGDIVKIINFALPIFDKLGRFVKFVDTSNLNQEKNKYSCEIIGEKTNNLALVELEDNYIIIDIENLDLFNNNKFKIGDHVKDLLLGDRGYVYRLKDKFGILNIKDETVKNRYFTVHENYLELL